MFKSKKSAPHLGASGINSPGYAPRKDTPQHADAEQWTKKYHEWLASTIGKGDRS